METDHNNDYWISKYKGLILGEKISELLFRPFPPLLCGSREILAKTFSFLVIQF